MRVLVNYVSNILFRKVSNIKQLRHRLSAICFNFGYRYNNYIISKLHQMP